jgi:hypothetical protein
MYEQESLLLAVDQLIEINLLHTLVVRLPAVRAALLSHPSVPQYNPSAVG